MHAPVLLSVLLASAASAHFTINYPTSRGKNSDTQGSGPCGGLDTPSSKRSLWSLQGDQLSIEAGHDEAKTAVYIALGNNPTEKDFTIIAKNVFNQIGLGTFCWNDLMLPENVTVIAGQNATIQVVQEGHGGGGLYNCADITFVEEMSTATACKNGSTSAEEVTTGSLTASASGTAASAEPSTKESSGMALKAVGGLVFGAVIAAGSWVL